MKRSPHSTPRGFALVAMWFRLAVLSVAEIAFGIVTGRGNHVSAVVASWTWNLAHWRDLLKLRKHVRKPPKSRPGSVTTSSLKTIRVRLEPDRLQRLLSSLEE